MKKNSVNIRVFTESRDRLKIKAIRKGKTLMEYIDDLSKLNSQD